MANNSDILHPSRANISKDELRQKLAEMYKASKDQVNVFGLRTQFGGGKTTGFALVYDSPEALKKFEPHYRLVRVGFATKIEKASRQQRTWTSETEVAKGIVGHMLIEIQASNVRTGKRRFGERPRSRVPRRRRSHRWLDYTCAGWGWRQLVLQDGLCLCMHALALLMVFRGFILEHDGMIITMKTSGLHNTTNCPISQVTRCAYRMLCVARENIGGEGLVGRSSKTSVKWRILDNFIENGFQFLKRYRWNTFSEPSGRFEKPVYVLC
jgi:ribosomal protein S24E